MNKPNQLTTNCRTQILLGLLMVAVAFYSTTLLQSFGSSKEVVETTRLDIGASEVDGARVIPVRTVDLEERRSSTAWAGRDIFSWGSPRTVSADIEQSRPRQVVVKKPERTQAEGPQEPRPVEVSLRGVFGPERLRIAVLEDEKRTFNAVEDDVIEGGYVVRRIECQAVRLHRAESGEPIDIEVPERR